MVTTSLLLWLQLSCNNGYQLALTRLHSVRHHVTMVTCSMTPWCNQGYQSVIVLPWWSCNHGTTPTTLLVNRRLSITICTSSNRHYCVTMELCARVCGWWWGGETPAAGLWLLPDCTDCRQRHHWTPYVLQHHRRHLVVLTPCWCTPYIVYMWQEVNSRWTFPAPARLYLHTGPLVLSLWAEIMNRYFVD